MDFNIQVILAACLILLIAVTRRRLLYEVQGSSLLVFKNSQIGLWIYSIFFLPGTILHELSHWLVAEILQVPTGKLEILPDLEARGSGEQKLGYVMTGHTGPIRGFLIGMAPFITGIASLMIMGYFLNEWWGVSPWWHITLLIYGLIVVGNSMMVSRADMRNWPVIAILSILTVLALYSVNLNFSASFYQAGAGILSKINLALGLTISLNLGIIAVSYTLRRILERVTKQKIVMRR